MMLAKILNFFRPAAPKIYKIVHDPDLGYVAAFNFSAYRWCAIDENGEISQSIDAIANPLWKHLWVATPEEAGRRINLHATARGRSEVWAA